MRSLELDIRRTRPADPRLKPRVARRRRRAEMAFLPAALEIVETPASPTARLTAAAMMLLIAGGIVWATVGKVDIITTAPGRVVATGRTKVIQPFETGVVTDIRVRDGEHVRAGQVLLLLDPTQNDAERARAASDIMLARLDAIRLHALLAGDLSAFAAPPGADAASVANARKLMEAQRAQQDAKLADLDHQIAGKRAEIAEVQAEIHRLEVSMPMLQAHMRIREQGVKTGFGNQIDYYDAMRALVDQQEQHAVELNKLTEAQQSLASVEHQRLAQEADFSSGILGDLAKAEATIGEKQADLDKATQLAGLQTLRAPVDGTVQQVTVHTVGGVVTPAQPLMEVVPDDAPLEVEAVIPNREIGFVRAGQSTEVKIEALEFTHYGLLHGTVTAISQDAMANDPLRQGPGAASGTQSEQTRSHADGASRDTPPDGDPDYVAHVAVREPGLPTEQGFVKLEPGMTATAEIRTGRRRVIDYLLSPLRQLRHDSLTER